MYMFMFLYKMLQNCEGLDLHLAIIRPIFIVDI